MNFRTAFEQKFPVPTGVAWNPLSHQYDRVLRNRCTAVRHEGYARCWAAWKGGMEHLAAVAEARNQPATVGACA